MYTKMMQAAIEQDLIKWDKPKVGDWTDRGIVHNFELNDAELGHRKPYGAYILDHDDPWARRSGKFYRLQDLNWLPSIEQLMGMVEPKPNFAWNYIGMMGRFADKNITYTSSFDSMREIWLALVIHELHNGMKWDGELWTL